MARVSQRVTRLDLFEGLVRVSATRTFKYHAMAPSHTHAELLQNIFCQGQLVYDIPSLTQSRNHAIKQLELFPQALRRFLNPAIYMVGLEENLFDLRMQLILQARDSTT